MKLCHHCGREVQLLSGIQRTDGCSSCHSDLKVCLNCRFFDPGMNNQCREPQAERQVDKQVGNFCDYFSFRLGGRSGKPAATDDARTRLDALFRKNR